MNKTKNNFTTIGNIKTVLLMENYIFPPISVLVFIVYIFVLCVIVKHRRKIFKDPFYKMCLSLGLNDVVALIFYSLNPIWSIYFYHSDYAFVWKAYVLRVSWYNSIFHTFLIALDRLYALALPHKTRWSTGNKKLASFLICCWCIAVLCNLCILTEKCSYIRYPDSNTVFYDFFKPGARLHSLILDLGIQVVILLSIVVMYLISWCYMRNISQRNDGSKKSIKRSHRSSTTISMRLRSISSASSSVFVNVEQYSNSDSRRQQQRRKRRKILQRLYLGQAICVTMPTILTVILYHISFYVNLSDNLHKSTLILSLICGCSSYLVNPIIYLTLNTQLRNVVFSYCNILLKVIFCRPIGITISVSRAKSFNNSSDRRTMLNTTYLGYEITNEKVTSVCSKHQYNFRPAE